MGTYPSDLKIRIKFDFKIAMIGIIVVLLFSEAIIYVNLISKGTLKINNVRIFDAHFT